MSTPARCLALRLPLVALLGACAADGLPGAAPEDLAGRRLLDAATPPPGDLAPPPTTEDLLVLGEPDLASPPAIDFAIHPADLASPPAIDFAIHPVDLAAPPP